MDYFDYYGKTKTELDKTNFTIQAVSVIAGIVISSKLIFTGYAQVLAPICNPYAATFITIAFIYTMTASLLTNSQEASIEFACAFTFMGFTVFIITQMIHVTVVFKLIKLDIIIAILAMLILIIGTAMSLFLAFTISEHLNLPIHKIKP